MSNRKNSCVSQLHRMTLKIFKICLLMVILFVACKTNYSNKTNSPLVLDMVHHNPGEKPYQSKFNDPQTIEQFRYNGKVYFLFESPALAINWETVDSTILPLGSEERLWVDKKAAEIREMHQKCDAEGLDIYAMSDLMLFPKRLIEKYNIKDSFGNPQDTLVQRLLRAQIDEMFTQFPSLDGLVVRIGETYLHDAPFHKGKINNKRNPDTTIIPLMTLLRQEICEKRNKTLIFRTWYSFDVDSAVYQKVSDSVEPHEKLIISIKHCEGDFHRGNPFSKNIGLGRHRQIVEVQCAREYEGKGAYPNYIANGVIEGFEEHNRMPDGKINSLREFTEQRPELYGGIWTWSRGGGWAGPYITNEMWCELNAYVMAHWANDPQQSEEIIFNQYAEEVLHLSHEDIAKFRKFALLSAKAVIRGRNSTYKDMFHSWTRDQGIGWPRLNEKNKSVNKQRNLQQKVESIAIWEEMLVLANEITWADDATKQFVISSTKYGLYLYQIYQSLVFLEDAEVSKDVGAMKKWIAEYDKAWEQYSNLTQKYPELPTLYAKDYKHHIKNPADDKVNHLRIQLGLNK